MAEPVAELDALLSIELDKSSFNKLNNQMKELRASLKSTMSGGVTREPLAQNLQTTTQQYKKTISQIKKVYGANDKQARAIMSSGLGADKSSLSYRLAQMSDKKATKSKNWTLKELAAKEEDYQFYKKMFSGKGYSGGQMIAKLNKELGPNYIQTRGKRKAEIEEYLLMKKENKERKKSIALQKGAKALGKLAGVGSAAAVVKKVVESAVRAGSNKLQSMYGYGGADMATMKKVFGVMAGDLFSNEEAEKYVDQMFGHITSKTQSLPSIGSDIKNMAIATMGRGTDFIQRYVEMIAEGAQTGTPQYERILGLANEVAGSGMSAADKRALITQMIGSEEAAGSLLKNAGVKGASDYSRLVRKYKPLANAGITAADQGYITRTKINEKEMDIGTAYNRGMEEQDIITKAESEASEKTGLWNSLFKTKKYKDAYQEAAKKEWKKRYSRAGLGGLKSKETMETLGIEDVAPQIGSTTTKGGDINITNNLYGNPSQEQVNAAGKLTKDETKNVNTKNMQKGGAW